MTIQSASRPGTTHTAADAAEPPRATGQYPEPVWRDKSSTVSIAGWISPAALEAEDAPEPPSPTGQYPDAVWLDSSTAAQTLAAEERDVPEPPGATGQYPEPVWAGEVQPAPVASAQVQSTTRSSAVQPEPAQSLADPFLAFKEIEYADVIEPAPLESLPTQDEEATVVLDFQEMYQIIRAVVLVDSGTMPFTAIAADPEYTTPGQPAYQQRQFGLGFGLALFTLESGLLGKLLQVMQRRDPARFAELFAPHADQLLASTNAATAHGRLQPVGDQLLWSQPWIERFQRAGEYPPFQVAQNETAIEFQFRPMLNVAFSLGFTTDRALAMVYDRVVTRGLGAGLRWVVAAAGPLRTATQRQHALNLLGFETVTDFQNTVGWTPRDGQFGLETHAALVGELRRQGQASLPGPVELMARLVAAAQGTAQRRLLRLRDLPTFADIHYRLV